MAERPVLVHLIGFPGTGKLTIATEMARGRGPRPRLVVVDNHLTSDAILAVVGADGVSPVERPVWDMVDEVRVVVRRAIRDLSPTGWSFVFTNVIVEGDEKGPRVVADLMALATARASTYIPVRLHCAGEERRRRVVGPDRHERHKWVDPDAVDAFVADSALFTPDAPHLLDLDVTELSAADAAGAVLDHATATATRPEP